MAVMSRWSILVVCVALIAGCGGGGSTTGNGGGTGGGSSNIPTVVTVTFSGATPPAAVAASIGTGAFTAEALNGGTATLSLPSGITNYAIAFICPAEGNPPSFQSETVFEANTADGTSLNLACLAPSIQTGTLTGSLDATAISGVQQLEVISQNGESFTMAGIAGDETTGFNVSALAGNDRILVLAYANPNLGPVAAKNFASQTVPGALNDGNVVTFGPADQTIAEPIAYNNVPSGFSAPNTFVGMDLGGTTEIALASGDTSQYTVLPASASQTGDVYILSGYASASSGSTVEAGVKSAGGPVSFTFPGPWSYGGPTPAALPTMTMSYNGFSGTNVSQNAFIQWVQNSGGASSEYVYQVEATASYQNGSTTLPFPDLSGLPGFLSNPSSGTTVTWVAWVEQQSYGLIGDIPLNGTWTQVSNTGQYTVP